jgi:hypothetical protein
MTYVPWVLGAQLDLTALDEWSQAPYRAIRPNGAAADGSQDIRAQVVVSEDADDDLQITQIPVEQSAQISDHAFRQPSDLRIQMGWSNAFAFSQNFSLQQIYEQILQLQASRIPFTVYTARRVYNNMLVASLRTHTDARMAFTFMCDISFKEVVLVNTSVVSVGNILNQFSLADPEATYPNVAAGRQQMTPAVVPDAQVPTDPASYGIGV